MQMEMDCISITKVILPAVRVNIAKQLDKKYGLSQKEIAQRLGVAQVAVSKYLNGNYSGALKKVANRINESGIIDSATIVAVEAGNRETVGKLVNDLCARIASNDLVN